MAKQLVNVGSSTNDGTGDTLRSGALKINANFTELYGFLGDPAGGQLNLVSTIVAGEGIIVSNPSGTVLVTSKPATTSTLGGVKIGNSLTVTQSGILDYNLPVAADDILGGVKVDGVSIVVDPTGVISAVGGNPAVLEAGEFEVTLELNGNLTLSNGVTITRSPFNALSTEITGNFGGWVGITNSNRSTRISVETSTVVVATNTDKLWTFKNNGDLQLPASGDIIDSNGVSVLGVNAVIPSQTNNGGKYLTTNGSTLSWATVTTGGGDSFDQSLNTTDDVVFNTVSAGQFVSTEAGVPTLTSSTNINLAATNAVVVTTSPFRLASLSQTQINALTAVNGDLVYNTTTNKIQGFQNGIWVELGLTTVDGGPANAN